MTAGMANCPLSEADQGERSVKNGDAARFTRVLHVNSGNMFGGVECILTTLARAGNLHREMESCFALCQEGRLSKELSTAGAMVYWMGAVRISRPWTVWQARRRMRQTF